MDCWQIKRQLAYLASAAEFPDPPEGLVFTGGSFVSEDLEGAFTPGSFLVDGPTVKTGTSIQTGMTPFCRVSCKGYEYDHESPQRVRRAAFSMYVLAGGGGFNGPGTPLGLQATPVAPVFDSHGINQVIGANRSTTNGQGQAQGKDADELVGAYMESLGEMFLIDSIHGIQGAAQHTSSMVPLDGVKVLRREISIEALNATLARTYHNGYRFSEFTIAGVGIAEFSWVAAPRRFDTFGYVLRRGTNPGDPAPTTPTGGTGVTVSGTTATATGLVVGQNYNASLFTAYTESAQAVAAATPDRYSGPFSISFST